MTARGPITGPLPVRYILAGLAFTLLAGTALGAVELFNVQVLDRAGTATHVQAHAHAQLFGLFGCVLGGLGQQLLPRFLRRPLPHPRLGALGFWLLVGGVAAHWLGQPASTRWAWGMGLMAASAPLMAGAGVTFAANPVRLAWAGREESWARALLAGAALFGAAMALDGALALRLFLQNERLYEASQAQALWTVALYGGVFLFVVGVAARLLPAFAGGRPVRARAVDVTLWVMIAATLLQATAWLWPYGALRPGLMIAGRAAVGVGLLAGAFTFFPAVWGSAPVRADRPLVYGIRAAHGFLACAGTLRLGAALAELRWGPTPSLVLDAERHLMTMGFLLLLTVSVGLKLLPGLLGVQPRWPRLRGPIVGMLALSVLLRSLQAVGGVAGYGVLKVSGLSGLLAWLALALFAAEVVASAIRARARARQA